MKDTSKGRKRDTKKGSGSRGGPGRGELPIPGEEKNTVKRFLKGERGF